MRNVFLFTRREYLQAVRKRSFLIVTMLIPLFMFAVTVLPSKLMMSSSNTLQKVVVATDNEKLAAGFREQLMSSDNAGARKFDLQVDNRVTDAEKASLQKQVDQKQLSGFLWAPRNSIDAGHVEYYATNASDIITVSMVRSSVNRAMTRLRLTAHGVPADQVDALLKPLSMDAFTVSKGQTHQADEGSVFLSVFGMMMLLYFVLIIYGMSVLRSILEEKNSRVFEVLLSAATPKQLMAGKILGTLAIGLTQTGIWAILASVLGISAINSVNIGGKSMSLNFSMVTFGYFALFFLLGFLLYSSMAAALGSVVTSEQEAQQLQSIVMMPIMISMFVALAVIQQPPNAPLGVVMSLIPFFTPLVMFVRVIVPGQMPPMWQIGLSIGLMLATIYGMLALCARIYRIGILMYGKRPTLPEIMKWIRYA